jgi:predicted enzyme related to lactoylglutathione lyase
MLSRPEPAVSRGTGRIGERGRHEPGSFCWIGLASSDPADANAFYASLFGWQGEGLPAGDVGTYWALRHDGREVAIVYRQTPEARAARAAPHWTVYVSVADVDASALLVRRLGGAVLRDPLDLADAGRVAAIRDPLGAIFSLWQPRAHAGAEVIDDIGALSWHELVTPDLERAKSFYAALLGWKYEAGPSRRTTIINAGSRIATMRQDRGPESASASSWIAYFGVASAQDAQETAERNGGRTMTAAADSPIGRTALLADRQGATFAVLEQPGSSSSSASA